MKFKDLETGVQFRFVGYRGVCSKRPGNTYFAADGNIWGSSDKEECILESKKFRDLAVGDKFQFTDGKNTYTKIGKLTSQRPDYSIWHCLLDSECILESKELVPEIKFGDLEIGNKFRFADGGVEHHVKVTAHSFRRPTGHYTAFYNMYRECILITKDFGDLAVGARFRFLGQKTHYTKTSEGYCSGVKCDSEKKCIELKKLTFEDLEIGAIFQFVVGDRMYYLKTGNYRYRIDGIGNDVDCDDNDEVRLLDSKIKKFDDIEVGRWFRYPEKREQFLKISCDWVRLWGSSLQHSCLRDRLIESLTFEEVEK